MNQQPTLTIGISSYNEGRAILPTLRSLWAGLVDLGREDSLFVLSDSSDSVDTVESFELWAQQVSANVEIHHSDVRRSLKEALNAILDVTESEVLICVVADVVVPPESLRALLNHLTCAAGCDAAIGVSSPIRRGRGVAGRASTWQLNIVYRLARSLRSTAVRADGVFWGARRSFYQSFRYRVGTGSIADDVQLSEGLSGAGWRVRNATDAVVYKVPASSLRDFAVTTLRTAASNINGVRTPGRWVAALREAALDPLGALCYLIARAYAAIRHSSLRSVVETEYWEVASTTKLADSPREEPGTSDYLKR